jgi:hypothetical protein
MSRLAATGTIASAVGVLGIASFLLAAVLLLAARQGVNATRPETPGVS